MSEADRSKWDERHAAGGPQEPDPFVVAALDTLRASTGLPRTALDVACGRGRHALLLAREGFDVLAVDVSGIALAALRDAAAREGLAVRALQADLDDGLPAGTFGVVVASHFFDRRLWPALRDAVAPGGLLVLQAFAAGAAERAGTSKAFCLENGEIDVELAGFEILARRLDDPGGRPVESVLARRPQVTS